MNRRVILICVDYTRNFTSKINCILLLGDWIFFLIKLFTLYFKTPILQTLLLTVHPTQLKYSPFNSVHCYFHLSRFLSCLLILTWISIFLSLITYFVIFCDINCCWCIFVIQENSPKEL